jgi:hypothetical protein
MPVDLTDSLVAHWPLNDNADSSEVLNIVGDGNATLSDIVNANTSSHAIAGKIGGALAFCANNQETDTYLNTNKSFLSTFQSSFSVCLWLRLQDKVQEVDQEIFGINDGTCRVMLSLSPTGLLVFSYRTVTHWTSCTTVETFFNDTNWHFLSVCISQINATQVTLCIFVDGQRAAEATANCIMSEFELSPYLEPFDSLFFGNSNYEGRPHEIQWVFGDMDNIQIFNKALTATEIAFLYHHGDGRDGVVSSKVYSHSRRLHK